MPVISRIARPRWRKRLWMTASLLCATFCLGGCSELSYYGQAIHGEMSLLAARKPISDILSDPATSPALRKRLRSVEALRQFARQNLDLPVGDNFSTYVALDRPYVVWNVFAAPPLALKAHTWCYPLIGCQGYRGFFHEADAEALAKQLHAQGLDTWVGGVAAYSTLGWFNDPILSTLWTYPPDSRAALIFHELAHRLLYVKGDTTFNESFAVTVQDEGVRRWLQQTGNAAEQTAWQTQQQRQAQIDAWLTQTRTQLQSVYQDASLSDAEKRRRKGQVLRQAQTRLDGLIATWPGVRADWFQAPLNNAKLIALQQYTDDIPAFRALLARCNDHLPAFYKAVQQLADLSKPDRQTAMQRLRLADTKPAHCGP